MRKLLLVAAAALLAIAVPATASAQSGHVDVSYASIDTDLGGDDIEAIGVGGQVAFGGSSSISFQVDAHYHNLSTDGGGDDADAYGIGGHVFNRGSTWLFGGYVGFDQVDDGTDDASQWTAALETQYYMARGTISGTLAHSDLEDLDVNTTSLSGEYRHFINDNFTVQVGAGIGTGEFLGTDVDTWQANVGAEYQFAAAPVSIFAGYRHGSLEADGGGDIDVDSVGVGVRWNFGGQTLFDRNRSGAGLNRVAGAYESLFGSF